MNQGGLADLSACLDQARTKSRVCTHALADHVEIARLEDAQRQYLARENDGVEMRQWKLHRVNHH